MKVINLGRLAAAASMCICLSSCGGSNDGGSPPNAPSTSVNTNELDQTETLTGVDGDSNGIRDDIEKQIDRYQLTETQRGSLKEYAKAIQKKFTSSNSEESLSSAATGIQQALVCASGKIDGYEAYIDDISASTFNTQARYDAQTIFESRLSGRVFVLPSEANCG